MKLIKLFIFSTLCFFMACVPARKLEEEQAKRKQAMSDLEALKSSCEACDTQRKELEKQVEEDTKTIIALSKDTALSGRSYRQLTNRYDKLNELNEKLLEKYNKLLAGSVSDTKKLSGELQGTQEELLRKQDELRALETKLNKEKQTLDKLNRELKGREERVAELEAILKSKDEAVIDLKEKVSKALLGFEDKGLTISQKNGKVYVSLDERLLFASGSITVEANGVKALKELAKVLEQNPDIHVMVEGHTDDVPMNGKGAIKDNWDLSVLRATSIVKIITKNSKVDPKRLTAAGRGEYIPVDNAKTKEARRKNRRTEIILTPKLDELFKVLDSY